MWRILSAPQMWFTVEGLRDWVEMLGPHPDRPDDGTDRYVVGKEAGDRIVVEKYRKEGDVFRVEASLAAGGNVVAYEGKPGADRKAWRRGRYEWALHPAGMWYLRHFEYQKSFDGDQPDRTYSLDVTEFDPNPSFAANQFELAGLGIEPGTQFSEWQGDRERTYRYGKPQEQKGVGQDVLEALGERLRSEGFASRERNEE